MQIIGNPIPFTRDDSTQAAADATTAAAVALADSALLPAANGLAVIAVPSRDTADVLLEAGPTSLCAAVLDVLTVGSESHYNSTDYPLTNAAILAQNARLS